MFLLLFSIKPTPSRTFVMSYILRFCTCSWAAASLRSIAPDIEFLMSVVNFLVKRPRDESYRDIPDPIGVFPGD